MKFNLNEKARFANERQNTPSKKACYTKIPIVIFRAIQNTHTVIVSTIDNFAYVN
jgi:hypothetical protein